ncbi:MAG: nucleotidyltransferase family protein, partial [Nanoarchaeota archaeon]|nr:nucleotidyltransferase family protein [Nanoarchaeota archaeon]
MKVVILVGGFGTRLREVVSDVPKPMALIAGKPFLEHQINFLKEFGLKDIILCVYYKADVIKSYFGDGRHFGVNLTYSEEDVPLGTAGAIKKAEKYIDGTFFVLNGDSYLDADLMKFLEFHKSMCFGGASMVLTEAKDSSNYGSVLVENNKVVSFLEKGRIGVSKINAGVYLFEPSILDLIPSGKKVSIEGIFPKLAEEGKLFGFLHNGYFIDIGRPETYHQFRQNFLNRLL